MPNHDAVDLKNSSSVHSGTFGNKSVVAKTVSVPSGAAIADVARFAEVPAGTIITDFRRVNDALGGTAQMSFGLRAKDGTSNVDDALVAAASVAAAGNARMIKKPVVVAKDSYVVGVLSASATAALGDVDVVLDYVYEGQ